MDKEIAILFNDQFGAFLCSFFGGIVATTTDSDLKKTASTNFIRLYKRLQVDDKKAVRISLDAVYGNGSPTAKELTEKLRGWLDDISEEI